MKRSKPIAVVGAAILSGAMLFSSAFAAAPSPGSFTALQGIDAQALSVDEMKAISGELNAIDIGNYLLALAGHVTNTNLQAYLTKLGNYYLTNADAINAFFAKLGILTPCKTCP